MPTDAPALTLRPAMPADAAFLADLYAATRTEEVAAFGWDEAATRAFLAQQHAAREAGLRLAGDDHVVEADGTPVGRVVVREEPTTVQVLDVAVLPAHQGRGVGTQVLRGILGAAHAAGLPVRLHVRAENVGAQALYARLGFVRVPDDGLDLLLEARP